MSWVEMTSRRLQQSFQLNPAIYGQVELAGMLNLADRSRVGTTQELTVLVGLGVGRLLPQCHQYRTFCWVEQVGPVPLLLLEECDRTKLPFPKRMSTLFAWLHLYMCSDLRYRPLYCVFRVGPVKA